MMQVEFLSPYQGQLSALPHQAPLSCGDAVALAFCAELSQHLMRDAQYRQYPELVALGFWLRDASIKQWFVMPGGLCKPLGTVLHITPNNVDSMFVYSWICALLMGNHNIVRVSNSDNPVKQQLIAAINGLLVQPQFAELASRNVFVSYARESDVSARLSLLADARVLWGGDTSVKAIRALPAKARCRDISFADRWSAALIDANGLQASQLDQLAQALWRDSQPHGQMACSSPRVLFWLGDEQHQPALWDKLAALAGQQDDGLTRANNQLVNQQLLAATGKGLTLYRGRIAVSRILAVDEQALDWFCGDGVFYLLPLTQLQDITRHLDEKIQTLSYMGCERDRLLDLLRDPAVRGVDRLVPIGQALDFAPLWDGYDLLSQLCRQVRYV